MFIYKRTAQYHETDQMAIVHHSNYIKWMEEARIAFLKEIGLPYAEMERDGITSPVVEINVNYKDMVRFDDQVEICVRLVSYNGVTLGISYEMKNEATGKLCTTATSKHCFLKGGRIVSPKKCRQELDEVLKAALEEGKNTTNE